MEHRKVRVVWESDSEWSESCLGFLKDREMEGCSAAIRTLSMLGEKRDVRPLVAITQARSEPDWLRTRK